MGYIDNLIDTINLTHPSLGELVAMCHIVVKARKFLLIVSPSGCGKSRAMEYIGKNTPNSWSPNSLSISSLANKVEKLTSFRSVICIDDIATIQTQYSRNTTITTLSALCYSHRVEPSMVGFDFCIEDFYGAALVGIQPVILRDLMLAPEWEASIQDKSIRYYHLKRPLSPNLTLPQFQLKHNGDIDDIREFVLDTTNPNWKELVNIGDIQWSRARVKEHLSDLLKAIAVLEGRKEVESDDYSLLKRLLKPLSIEQIAVKKDDLEGDRQLDNNLLALLVEYYTYGGEYALAQVALDYKLTLSQCYRIMQKQASSWKQISKSPTVYTPSKGLQELLKEYHLEVNHREDKSTV